MLSRVSVTTPHSDHDLSKEAMLSSDFRYLFSILVPSDIETVLSMQSLFSATQQTQPKNQHVTC